MVPRNAKFWLSAALLVGAAVGCADTSKEEVVDSEGADTAEADADTDTDTDTDADGDTDTDTDTDTDADTDALFTVDTAVVSFDFAVQGGVIKSLPGNDSVMRIHFFEGETFHGDLDRQQDQCAVELSLTDSSAVDLTGDYPGLLGAWAIDDVAAATAGTIYRCDYGNLDALGGDAATYVSSLELGFGVSAMDGDHASAFEAAVEGWEAVATTAGFGILNASFEGSLASYDQYIVVGYALDGDNVAVLEGKPVQLDLQTAWHLPDGVYQARPVGTEFGL
ncbi:MAG: hypothetical protein CL927_19045 [Deltaproteobacteria bacterium]|nr:hypothetical protein [Deltaproteobacteria bacterium]